MCVPSTGTWNHHSQGSSSSGLWERVVMNSFSMLKTRMWEMKTQMLSGPSAEVNLASKCNGRHISNRAYYQTLRWNRGASAATCLVRSLGSLDLTSPAISSHTRCVSSRKTWTLPIFPFSHLQNAELDSLWLSSLPGQKFKHFYHGEGSVPVLWSGIQWSTRIKFYIHQICRQHFWKANSYLVWSW